MFHKSTLLVVLLLSVAFAGCVSDDDGTGQDEADVPVMTQVDDPESFFHNAWYDANRFDPSVLSQPIHDILPVEEVWTEVSDGTMLHSGVYRPDTDEPTPVFINFSPYHGDAAEARGDAFGQYMIDHYVPRGYTVVLSSIRGTGHSEGCFEVASDREAMDLSEVVDFFAAQEWSNGHVAAGGKSYDSTTQNGAIAKFPTSNLKAIFHVSGITDMYEYTYHNGLPAREDAAAFNARYGAGQSLHEYGVGSGAPSEDATHENDGPESLARLAGEACQENAENLLFPGSTVAAGSKTDYWVERDWNRYIGDTEWDGSIFFYHGFHDWNVQPSHILPWLDNLPEHIDTKVWLHQDKENFGHLYPMRADWNLTMLRWLDQELKGIDTGFFDEAETELQGSDGLWRRFEQWPLEEPVTTELTLSDGLLLAAEANSAGYAYAGAPSITVTATPTMEDPVFSAILWDEDPNGTRVWRNEATLRVLYRDGLEEPEPVTPGEPVTFTVDFYPQNDVLLPGHKWIIEFQAEPAQTVVTSAQLAGLEVDATSAVIIMTVQPGDQAVMEHQPVPTTCFAC